MESYYEERDCPNWIVAPWEEGRNMSSGEPVWPIPMKAIGAQNLLTMPGGVTMAGYLHKRGGKQLQLFKWPLRYVIVHKGCVYYFKSSTSASSQGAFSLNGYNRVMRAAEETTSSNVFPFKMVHISKKHRTWYFSAASEEERKKWMLALRKEIDRFHEKKETITDLSDSESDSDSFYGSVERPVAINYVHNPADDSWQDDEDDDEEDYVKPDDGAPSYPPPPVPRPPKVDEPPKRQSISSQVSKPKSPIPPVKMPDLDSNRNSTAPNYKLEIDRMPPPIPTFTPAHRMSGPKPPPPPPPQNDKPLPPWPRRESACPVSSTINQPSFPPFHRSDSPSISGSTRSLANYQPSEAKHLKFWNSSMEAELNNILKQPPLVPQKPAVPSTEKISSKSNHVPAPPPVLPVKPPSLFESVKTNHTPPVPPNKPRIPVQKSPDSTLTKPPAIAARPQRSPLTSLSDKPGFPPPLRLPPDGQSFIDKTVDSPIRSKSVVDDQSNSDDDYEKVPLPASVYVDTCDSGDVERMFKAADTRGSPLNGLFCIRNSSTKSGKVIVVWDNQDGKTRNYRIYEKDFKVYLEAEIHFPDIGTLVEHYYGNPLPGHNTLVLKYAYGCSNNHR